MGAGCAGITAARELYRAGYDVTIFEASSRIGGRHYTDHVDNRSTAMEMGAMRFPFFADPGSANSVLDYFFRSETQATLAPFPNPGAAPGNTGIYLNDGFGPEGKFYPKPTMSIWQYAATPTPPPEADLAAVYTLVNHYLAFFSGEMQKSYATPSWGALWARVLANYDKLSFSDLVYAPALKPSEYQGDGWLGGFGMNPQQAQLFYTIGSGDGSWGAFYEIGAMWFIRCVMFGFNTNLQSLIGLPGAQALPFYGQNNLLDSSGQHLAAPRYQGIQALVEWLFFAKAPGQSQSLYEASRGTGRVALRLNNSVDRITKSGLGFVIRCNNEDFWADHVIVTSPIWSNDIGLCVQGISPSELPLIVKTAQAEQHIIASCKVFFELKQNYWLNPDCKIPQIIVTDTFVQDAYGVNWSANEPGVLLASYTWEDDAVKLWPLDDKTLAQKVLAKLDSICMDTLGQQVSPFVVEGSERIMQWSRMPGYHGCAKLYRQRNGQMNDALLAYNQNYSAASKLYFAGENYSVEGGWTEPALRMALDATIRLIQNTGGTFNNGFSMQVYPHFSPTPS